MIVCYCMAVTDREIRDAARRGAATVAEVARACRAGTGCRGCHPVVESLLEEERGEFVTSRSSEVDPSEPTLSAS